MEKKQDKSIDPISTDWKTVANETPQISDLGIKVLVQGLARLAEGQRCFADEFGLKYSRVFSSEYEDFKGQKPEKIIWQWLREGEDGAQRLQQLFDDLVKHQLALLGALEGIASEAVAQLCPKRAKLNGPGILGLRPFAWRSYRNLHRKYAQDHQLRLNELVINGFVSGYTREREKTTK
ncbi:MAG: type VI secretion system-associated FHA domain protein [Desulfuromonas sp.]